MQIEETIKSLFSDVNTLQEGRQPQAGELYRGVKELHDKWMSVHTTMQVCGDGRWLAGHDGWPRQVWWFLAADGGMACGRDRYGGVGRRLGGRVWRVAETGMAVPGCDWRVADTGMVVSGCDWRGITSGQDATGGYSDGDWDRTAVYDGGFGVGMPVEIVTGRLCVSIPCDGRDTWYVAARPTDRVPLCAGRTPFCCR